MTTMSLTDTDLQVRDSVLRQLDWDPEVDDSAVGVVANADLDARHVTVTVSGDVAALTGNVDTWLQRDTAERAAANAPGIRDVDNRIVVKPPDRPQEPEIC